jgi:hypothetical protein
VGERPPHTRKVAGSIPAGTTTKRSSEPLFGSVTSLSKPRGEAYKFKPSGVGLVAPSPLVVQGATSHVGFGRRAVWEIGWCNTGSDAPSRGAFSEQRADDGINQRRDL